MKTVIVLAMHGTPAADFPREQLAEFFRLRSAVHNSGASGSLERLKLLDERLRNWPRNEQNDPFYTASQNLAERLRELSGNDVVIGYNEFCAPTLEQALQQAADRKPDSIIVVTPMMTRGGEHAEKEIPAAIEAFRISCPDIKVSYAWPFDVDRVARFLLAQIT